MSTAPAPTRPSGVTIRPPRMLLAAQGQVADSVTQPQVDALVHTGELNRPPTHAVVVYQITHGAHEQTGVLAEISVSDYRGGHIRPHEATDPQRVHRLAEHTLHTRVEQTPVLLGHTPRTTLRDALAPVTTTLPTAEFTPDGAEQHRVWIVDDPALARTVHTELTDLSTLYIADGHHRMAAADRFVAWQPDLTADHPGLFRLGALFPHDEMRSFAFPRSLSRSAVAAPEWLLETLSAAPGAQDLSVCHTSGASAVEPGVAGVFLDGQWYRLRLRPSQQGARAALDAVRLDEQVLQPALGNGTVTPVSGIADADALATWCTTNDAVGFLPHPPTVTQIMAVADAGEVLPAKSTWFAPKAPQGLFLRELA